MKILLVTGIILIVNFEKRKKTSVGTREMMYYRLQNNYVYSLKELNAQKCLHEQSLDLEI